MPEDKTIDERIEKLAMEEGWSARYERMKLYCANCGRAIVYNYDGVDEPIEMQLFTYQENGKRYTGIFCGECIEQKSKKRIIAFHSVGIVGGVTLETKKNAF